MMKNISEAGENNDFRLFYRGVLNSYSQVFFSDNMVFSLVIILVTFIDPFIGVWGLASVLITNLTGMFLGFDKRIISRGIYGFNSLLVGLGLGVYFAPGWHFLIIVLLAAVFTLFISISAEGVIGKYQLPYLSIPFIISIWIIMLSTRDLTALGVSQRGVYTLNELYGLGGHSLVRIYEWWSQLGFPASLRVYFISLGAVFFQYTVLSGVILAGGLLYYSRIAFILSLLGFYSAFIFYEVIGADLDELNYSYIGFNYILTSIAIGGFFIIPSLSSYLSVIFFIPLVALVTISLGRVFAIFQLPIYSLPFNIIVLLFLYVLKFRINKTNRLITFFYQYNSPEKNLYAYKSSAERLAHLWDVQLKLPFFGEWTVTQGYDGEHTHKDEWRHALDFEILDDEGSPFRGTGEKCIDYYCFDKAVLSPSGGTVEEVINDIPDNSIGEIDLVNNWGNTVIIRHREGLYSKLSHLRENSVTVKKGDTVKKGQRIAKCGNSGHSPVPHLHFQLQSTPWVGSTTIEFPLSHYILKINGKYEFRSYDIPEKDNRLMNVEKNPLLGKAFDFIPGKKIRVSGAMNKKDVSSLWEVKTSIYKKTYILCGRTGARAWFENDGTLFYFTHFEGNRSSLLYYFFLAAYKVQLGFYPKITLEDKFAVNRAFRGPLLCLQDLVAPFYLFLRSGFRIDYKSIDSTLSPGLIKLQSTVDHRIFSRLLRTVSFEMEITRKGLHKLTGESGDIKIEAKWED